MASRLADGLSEGFLGQGKQGDQSVVSLSLINRIEVFALEILNQSDSGGLIVVHGMRECRHFMQTGRSGGAPASLTSDNLVAPRLGGMRPDQQRLQYAARPD